MKCERCGSILPDHSLFCENCGARLHTQTQMRRDAGESGANKPANTKRGRRAKRARRIRRALLTIGALAAVAILFLGIDVLINAKTTRAIASADGVVTSALAEFVDSNGIVSPEDSEAALSAVYQSAVEAVSRGTFESAEMSDNCVAIGLPGGGYYVYVVSDGATDVSADAPCGFASADSSTAVKPMRLREDAGKNQSKITLTPVNNQADSAKDKLKVATIQPYCKETRQSHPAQWEYPDLAAQNIAANLDAYTYADSGTAGDDNRNDEEVSIGFLKTLSQYAVVIWHGHGGYTSGTGSFLCTTDAFRNRYLDDLRKGLVVRLYGGKTGATSAFFEKYLKRNVNENSLIYLGTCLSGKDSGMADAFLEKGFDCVVANSDTISRTYNLSMLQAFFDGMSENTGEPLTAQEALENAKLICGSRDPYYKKHAVPILFGDAGLRFAAESRTSTAEAAVSTENSAAVPAEEWAQAYADVLGSEEVGTAEDSFTPIVFMLLDMNGDGIPELIAANTDGDKAEELVFTPNESGATILEYAVYTYQNNEAVCLISQWNSYSNCVFNISSNRNIVSGDSGTGFEGFIVLNYDGNELTAAELATDWAHAELEGREEPYYLYGEYPNLQDIGSGSLEYISESEYDAKYAEIFNGITMPVFYDNTAEMRSRIFGVR